MRNRHSRRNNRRTEHQQHKASRLREKAHEVTCRILERYHARLAWWRRAFRAPATGASWIYEQARTWLEALMHVIGLAPSPRDRNDLLAAHRFTARRSDRMQRKRLGISRKLMMVEPLECRVVMTGAPELLIELGFDSSSISQITEVGSDVYFVASTREHGQEVWKLDADSPTGASLAGDVNPGSFSSRPNNLTNVNGRLFFTANDGVNGRELWRIDESGIAEMVEDAIPGGGIRPGGQSSYPNSLTNVNGTLFFSANDGVNGPELWRIDDSGIAEMVEDAIPGGGIRPGAYGSYPGNLTNANGTLFFNADDGVSGSELWVVRFLNVVGSTPANGAVVAVPPTEFVLDFSQDVDPTTVDAEDLTVNGIPADSVTQTDANTLTFHFSTSPVSAQGLQSMQLAQGALTSVSGGLPVQAFSSNFSYDTLLMQVVSTAPTNGSVAAIPFTTLDLTFNEPYDFASASASDFAVNQGIVTGVSQVDADTLRLTLSGITVEGTLTVGMAAGAMTDVFGNPGAAFSASYILDIITLAYPTPFQAVGPSGSLVYEGTIQTGIIGSVGDKDGFTLRVDRGQTISVIVHAASGLQSSVALRDSKGVIVASSTATAPGSDALIQTFRVPGPIATTEEPLDYTVEVSGVAGTIGEYAVQVILNSALEQERYGGAANNSLATAQSIDSSFITLNTGGTSSVQPARAAVQGITGQLIVASNTSAQFLQVDPLTGIATVIASGVNNNNGYTDLAYNPITDLLYGSGARGDSGLYVIDPATGAGTLIGNPGRGMHSLVWSPDGATLYGVSQGSFGTIDTSTGDFSFISYLGDFAHGMAFQPGTDALFAIIGRFNPSLYTINPTDGATSFVSALSHGYQSLEFQADGTLLAGGDGNLYRINPMNGAETYVGTTGAGELIGLEAIGADALDTYSFTLNAGQSANIVATGVGSKLELLNSTGVSLAKGVAANDSEQVISEFFATSSGTYYIQVTRGSRGDYNLLVTRNSTFDDAENNSFASAQDLIGPEVAAHRWAIGHVLPAVGDFYRIRANGNKTITIETSLPASASGNFVNDLDPILRLYNASGDLMATNDNRDSRDRNAKLEYKVPKNGGGDFYIEIAASGATSTPTQGEYFLSVKGAEEPALDPFAVAAINIADGQRVRGPVTTLTIDFNDIALLTTLQTSDVKIDGLDASNIEVIDGNTIIVTIGQVLSEGNHTVTIAAGALRDIQNTPIQAFSSSFYHDITAPQIVYSSIQEGEIVTKGYADLTIRVEFSEAMDTTQIDIFDFSLVTQLTGSLYYPSEATFDAGGTELTLTFSGINNEDLYTLTMASGDFALQDTVGWDLDGEALAWPIPSNTTGDGIEGGDFVVSFTLDASTRNVTGPLIAVNPLGSLIYRTASASSGAILPVGDTDDWTIELNPGQTLSVLLDPSFSLAGSIEIIAPDNTTVGSAIGSVTNQTVLLQTAPAVVGGVYTIRIGGDSGTIGQYSFEIIVNAALEEETYGGPSNDDTGSAQSLESSFISLPNGATRGAVIGQTDPGSDIYSLTLADNQSVSIAATSLTGGDVNINLLDGGGDVIASGIDVGTNVTEFIAFAGGMAGTYYVQVTGDSAVDYSLVVIRDAVLEIEDNNSPSTAQPLDLSSGSSIVLGYVAADQIMFNAFDSGWYLDSGFHDPASQNYFTGFVPGFGELRGFWAFDLAGLSGSGTIVGAHLELFSGLTSDIDFSETIAFYDVTTPVDELVAGGDGLVDIYADLGSGIFFGSREVFFFEDFTVLQFGLNADAITAVLEAAGNQFAIGSALTTIDFNSFQQNLFGFSTNPANRKRLVLEIAEQDYYEVTLAAGQTLNLITSTPGGGSGEFVNNLDPVVRVYDADGNVVAQDDNSADGRNAMLAFLAESAGTYWIEVSSSGGIGEYTLSLTTIDGPAPTLQNNFFRGNSGPSYSTYSDDNWFDGQHLVGDSVAASFEAGSPGFKLVDPKPVNARWSAPFAWMPVPDQAQQSDWLAEGRLTGSQTPFDKRHRAEHLNEELIDQVFGKNLGNGWGNWL